MNDRSPAKRLFQKSNQFPHFLTAMIANVQDLSRDRSLRGMCQAADDPLHDIVHVGEVTFQSSAVVKRDRFAGDDRTGEANTVSSGFCEPCFGRFGQLCRHRTE